MPEIWVIYSTFPNRDEAFSVAGALLEKQLIACANVHSEVTSLYRWEGAIQKEEEAVMVAKTSENRVKAAIAMIKGMHSYQIPCILAYPAGDGLPAFAQWVAAETAEK